MKVLDRLMTDPDVQKAYAEMYPHAMATDLILDARSDVEMTQQEFAKRLDCTVAALSRYESGEHPVPDWAVERAMTFAYGGVWTTGLPEGTGHRMTRWDDNDWTKVPPTVPTTPQPTPTEPDLGDDDGSTPPEGEPE